MKHYRIDIRAHQLDINFFEDYLVIFLTWIKQFSKYSWSIEEDNTINRHLHCYIVADIKRSEDVLRQLTRNDFKNIIKSLSSTQTKLDNFIKIQIVSKTPLKALGYTQKFNSSRRGHSGFTDEEIVKAIEYYYTSEKYDKKEISDRTDWRKVNTRNFHSIMEEYISTHNLTYKDPNIIELMNKDRFTFIDIPVKTLGRGFKELRLAHDQSCQADVQEAHGEYHGLEANCDDKYKADAADMAKLINELCKKGKISPDDISEHHKEIIFIYL